MLTPTARITLVLGLAIAPGCYHGLDDDSSSNARPDDASDGATPGSSSDAATTSSEQSSSAADSSSGEPVEIDRVDQCSQCGCVAWVAQMQSPSVGEDLRVDLASMPDGGVLLAAAGAGSLELRRFDANGALHWSRSIAGAFHDLHIAAVGDGYFLLAGSFTGAIELTKDDPAAKLVSNGGSDGFLTFHTEVGGGAPIWKRTFGDAADQRITGLARTGDCDGTDLKECHVSLAGVAVGDLGLPNPAPGTRLLALATSLGTLWALAFAGGASFRGW